MQKISMALVKAQKAFGPALKSSTNPHFKNRYADLAACVEAVVDALNDNGIMLMQPCHEVESGVMVETLFIHESGEQMSAGKLHVPSAKQDPQGYGSAITYARRYSLMAACGIAPEDDDGNAAANAKRQEAQRAVSGAWDNQLKNAAAKGLAPLQAVWEAIGKEGRKAIGGERMAQLKSMASEVDKPLYTKMAEAPDLDTLYALADVGRELTEDERQAFEKRQQELEG